MMAHDGYTSNDEHFAVVYWTKSDDTEDDSEDILIKKSILSHPYFIQRNMDDDECLHISVDNYDVNLDPYGGAFVSFETEINMIIVNKLLEMKEWVIWMSN